MFVGKVKDQTAELEVRNEFKTTHVLTIFTSTQAVRKRNSELLQKRQRLEVEQHKLNDLVKSNQVDVITKKNALNELLEDLKKQKKRNLTALQRLEICKEQIEMMQDNINALAGDSSATELGPIREKWSFKWDVVECLQEKLIETRLQTAEKEEILTELKRIENDLKKEMELLKNTVKDALPVSRLQEQFLSARLREADVILEFDKLKRTLAIIKRELEQKKLETELELSKEKEEPFHIQFNLRDRYHEQIKSQEDASIARTVELQNEIDHLKMQIKKLEEIKVDIAGRVYFNEEVKVHLYEVKTSIYLRLQKTNRQLGEVIERNKKLEEKIVKNLSEVQSRIDDKDVTIAQLAKSIEDLQLRNEMFAKSNDESMASMNEETVNKLQTEIESLEAKVRTLHETRENCNRSCNK
ncbi:hypothetical protein NQ315_006467 [Exocentrus adspersus]|uniref:Coiled-coil domain-containing protein 39 n=1 Tax=Exocentrus adspersus TaxID=1586481 RepID=A0AAV8W0B1_9CUCU|nr:hypothetical protein NQ315_006467 [Exocentrus adspersus]